SSPPDAAGVAVAGVALAPAAEEVAGGAVGGFVGVALLASPAAPAAGGVVAGAPRGLVVRRLLEGHRGVEAEVLGGLVLELLQEGADEVEPGVGAPPPVARPEHDAAVVPPHPRADDELGVHRHEPHRRPALPPPRSPGV